MIILAAHPQRQYVFQLCTKPKKTGSDVVSITTVYGGSHALKSLSKQSLSGDNLSCAKGKHCRASKVGQIAQRYELLGLVTLLLSRMPVQLCSKKRPKAYIPRRTFSCLQACARAFCSHTRLKPLFGVPWSENYSWPCRGCVLR